MKWFHVFLFKIYNSILLIDGILKSAKTLARGGPGSDGNEELLRILQTSRTESSPSDVV